MITIPRKGATSVGLWVVLGLWVASPSWAVTGVVGTTPSQDQLVGTDTPELVIVFSEPIDPATATTDTVRLIATGGVSPTPGSDDTAIAIASIIPEAGNTQLRIVTQDPLPDGEYAWVVYGSASGRTGPGYGLYFNNNIAYFDTTPFTTLADEMTLEAWVRFDDWASYGSHTYGAVFDVGQQGREVPGYRLAHERDTIFFDVWTLDDIRLKVSALEALAKGEWRHVASVVSPAGVKLYIDGELAGEMPETFRPDSIAPYIEVALTGYSRWAGAYDYVLGMFDEMRVWNVARSGEQIRSTMYTPLVGDEPGLLLYHPLDQTAGDVLVDATSYGYDGDRNNTPREPSQAPLIEMAATPLTDVTGTAVDAIGDGYAGGVLVSTFTVDTSAPRVTKVSPNLTGDIISEVVSAIEIEFDDAMDPSTLVAANVALIAAGADGVVGTGDDEAVSLGDPTYDPDTHTAVVAIPSALATGRYAFSITQSVSNVLGISLDGEMPGLGGSAQPLPSGNSVPGGDFVVQFSVDTPPQVVAMNPAPGTRHKDITQVAVTFSEALDQASVTPDSFQITGDGPDNVLGTADDVVISPDANEVAWDGDALTARFGVSGGLASDTYHVSLGSSGYVADDFDDALLSTRWQLNGAAVWNDTAGRVELVPAEAYRAGSLVWREPVWIDAFTVEFDFHIVGDEDSADGLTCFFWDHDSPEILGGYGYSLGLSGAPGSGYAVEFDVFQNSGYDADDNHIALVTKPTVTSLTTTYVPEGLATAVEPWHVRIAFDHGHVQVWAGNDVLGVAEAVVVDYTIAGFVPYTGYLGFTAGTGGAVAVHVVDNVVIDVPNPGHLPITDTTGVPLDGEFTGALPSGDGVAGGRFVATFDIDVTPPIVTDTIPADGDADTLAGRSQVAMAFNEDMDAASLANPDVYSVIRNGIQLIAINGATYDGATRTVSVHLNDGLALLDGNYTVLVDGHLVTDEAGNRLDGDRDGLAGGSFTFRFVRDTLPPRVSATDPADGAVVSDWDLWLIEVLFDSSIDPDSAESLYSYRLVASGGDGEFGDAGDYLVLIDSAWYSPQANSALLLINYGAGLPDDDYQLTVYSAGCCGGIRDLAGNPLDGNGDGTGGDAYVARFEVRGGIRGDLDGDCDVDLADYQIFAAAFSGESELAGDPACDLDEDGDCDLSDLGVLLAEFGGPGMGCW